MPNIRTVDGDDLIREIGDTLAQWDGKDLAEIGERVLGHTVIYKEDSMFDIKKEA